MSITHANLDGSFETMPTDVVTPMQPMLADMFWDFSWFQFNGFTSISKVCEHCPRNAMVDHGFVDSFDSFETKLYDDRSAVDRVQWNLATTLSRPRVGHEQSSSSSAPWLVPMPAPDQAVARSGLTSVWSCSLF